MQDTIKSDSFPLKNCNKYFHNPRPNKATIQNQKEKITSNKIMFKKKIKNPKQIKKYLKIFKKRKYVKRFGKWRKCGFIKLNNVHFFFFFF